MLGILEIEINILDLARDDLPPRSGAIHRAARTDEGPYNRHTAHGDRADVASDDYHQGATVVGEGVAEDVITLGSGPSTISSGGSTIPERSRRPHPRW